MRTTSLAFALALLAWCGMAHGTLPPPSPAQAQAAAAKKAAADAQAQKDKEALMASMDTIAGRWRSRAASQGWHANPAVAIAAPAAAASAPATSAAPGGKAGPATPAVPIRSEKLGTAPPSADVKKKP